MVRVQDAIILIISIFIAVIVQTVALPSFPSNYIWSDFMLGIIVILGLKFNLIPSVALTVLAGLILDDISLAPFGTSTLSFIAVLFVIRSVKANIYIENRGSLFVWLIVFGFLVSIFQDGMLLLRGRAVELNVFHFWMMALQAVWNAIIGILVIPMLEKILKHDFTKGFRKKGLRI